MDKAANEAQRTALDNRVYELDTYRSILIRVQGFDYRFVESEE